MARRKGFAMVDKAATAGQFLLDNAEAFEKSVWQAFDKWGSKATDKDFYHAFFECKIDAETGEPLGAEQHLFSKAA